MKPSFEIDLLPDAVEFVENLDEKTREKIYYNIKKAQIANDNELFKKLNDFCKKITLNSKVKYLFKILIQN